MKDRKSRTLISYFATNASKNECRKIKQVKFSDIDVNTEDISSAMRSFENLEEISLKFGPFEKHFPTIPDKMPNVRLEDYTHGEKHVKFLLNFAEHTRMLSFKECDYFDLLERVRRSSELSKKFAFSGTMLINLERIYETDLRKKSLQLNINNIGLIPEDILRSTGKISFWGTLKELEQLTEEDLKKIDDIILVANKASEVSVEQLDELINKKKIPVKKVQLYSEYNSTNQNIPYNVTTYMTLRKKLEELVAGIPDTLSEEKKFAKIYERVAKKINYDNEKYPEDSVDFKDSRNLINALLKGKSVCAGYADVLEHALSLKGIESVKASGDALNDIEPHNWNKVKINGIWYNIDVTWDRENIFYGAIPEFALKSDEEFGKTRMEYLYDKETPSCEKSFSPKRLRRIFTYKVYPVSIKYSRFREASNRLLKRNRISRRINQEIIPLTTGAIRER